MESLDKKIDLIRKYKAEHPSATYDEMREEFQCSYSTISAALSGTDVIPHSPKLAQPIQLCPKTAGYIAQKMAWAKKNGRKYEFLYLQQCFEELMSLV